jgi:hypothetical protein
MKNGPPSSQSGPEAHLQNPAKGPDLLKKSGSSHASGSKSSPKSREARQLELLALSAFALADRGRGQ